ncbi:MAG TPA: hypothetical protein PLV92_24185, partial [Pirellulaceae bacterium]|nr:hypothetical protein [Pirellulaceae bacterium]
MNSMAYVVLGLLSLPAQAAPSSGAPSAVQPATFDPVAADTVERRTEPPSRPARGTSDSATEPDDASLSRTTSKKSSGGKTKLTPVAPQAVDAFATNPQKYQVSDAPTDAKKRVTASVSSGPQRPAASATSGPSSNNFPLKLVDTGPKAPSPSPAGAKPSPKAATASVKSAPSKPADVKPTERKIADAQTPSRGATPSVASAPSKTHVASDSNSASTKPASGMFANLR